MPLVLAQAVAMEMPVISAETAGVRELVADAGILVPTKDTERLAEAMRALMLAAG